jgi:hypothetical protein
MFHVTIPASCRFRRGSLPNFQQRIFQEAAAEAAVFNQLSAFTYVPPRPNVK